ncbi:hypothetical protein GALMADRAFT_33842, partial [Galerina marginata CBS 339.88]
RKLIVLDLNGTLVLRSAHQKRNPYVNPTQQRPLRTVHPRPYLSSFVSFVLHPDTKKWLDVMVWSSAQPHSVDDMVQKSFKERRKELKAVWARDTLGLSGDDYYQKTQTVKDLEKPPSLTLEEDKPRHSAKTTLLVDDSPLKAILQPWNHLCIPEYVQEMRRLDLAQRASGSNSASASAPSSASVSSNELVQEKPDVQLPESTSAVGNRRASDEPAPVEAPIQYDPTLLAVIGILDHLKHEENVASWMHSGGLLHAPTSASSSSSTPTLDHTNKQKLWFEHPTVLAYWASRGREALQQLELEVTSGVE